MLRNMYMKRNVNKTTTKTQNKTKFVKGGVKNLKTREKEK